MAEMVRNIRKYILERHEYDVFTKRFLNMFELPKMEY